MTPPVSYHTAFLIALIATLSPATAADWASYANAPGGGRYVDFEEITPDNIDALDVAWTFNSGDVSDGSGDISQTSFQATPIYFDEKLIVCTPFSRVVALDPATGEQLWSFDPKVDTKQTAATRKTDGAPLRCRGVTGWSADDAIGNAVGLCARTVFLGTIDARIFALDAASGKPCPAFNNGAPIELNTLHPTGNGDVNISSPPAVIGNKVVFGLSIGDNGYADMPDGVVRAFDARSGELVWDFDPIPAALRDKTGAANVWAPLSASETLDKVFLPTTSPSPDYFGGLRTDALPHADSIVALSASTGEPDWAFKVVRHNLWDYDLASQPVVIETGAGPVDGPVIAQATKQGLLYLLDARTGEPVFPMKEIEVPASDIPGETSSPTQRIPTLPEPIARTQINANDAFGLTVYDAWTCRKTMKGLTYNGPFTPPSTKGTLNVPGYAGGVNWGGLSVDPKRRILVVNSLNLAAEVRLIPEADFKEIAANSAPDFQNTMMKGTPWGMQRRIIMSPFGVPCSPPPWAEIMAIDLKTGKELWRRPHGQVKISFFATPEEWGSPGMGGSMVTGSGLVFIGASMDRTLRAYDIETGEIVWRHDVPASAMASPMSYMHDGRQYVVAAAGGHAGFGEFGDALVAFALPD